MPTLTHRIKKGANLLRSRLGSALSPLERIFEQTGEQGFVALYAHYDLSHDDADGRRQLEASVRFLTKHCNVLRCRDALERLARGKPLPRRAVVLTVDDATLNFYRWAWPAIASAGIPITVAVIPGMIRSQTVEHRVARIMRFASDRPEQLRTKAFRRALEDAGAREFQGLDTLEKLFHWGIQRPSLELQAIEGAFDEMGYPHAPHTAFAGWDELREMAQTGLVDFLNHTMSHPPMRYATGAWLEWELDRASALIRENLGVAPDVFAYPYGKLRDSVTPETTKAVAARFSSAFLTEPGVVTRRSRPHRLPRMPAEVGHSELRFHCSPGVCSLIYPLSSKT